MASASSPSRWVVVREGEANRVERTRPWYKTVGPDRRSYYRTTPAGRRLVRFPAPTNQQAQRMRYLLRNYWWLSCRDVAACVGLLGPVQQPKFIVYA